MADILLNTLKHCNLTNEEVGTTFVTDHVQKNGMVSESSLDHVYHNLEDKVKNIKICTLKNSSSDHYPVVVTYLSKISKKKFNRKITKRSMKRFNTESWNKALNERDWSKLENENDLEKKLKFFLS